MRKCGVIGLAVALFLACLVSYSLFGIMSGYSANFQFTPTHTIEHTAFGFLPHLFLAVAGIHSANHFHPNKNGLYRKADVSGVKLRFLWAEKLN
jgi:hypothetical protein